MTSHCENTSSLKNVEAEFDKLFQIIVKDLVDGQPVETSDAQKWFEKVLNYNVPHGKRNRGLTVIHSFQYLIDDGKSISDEDFKIAGVIGWCIELLQAFFLVSDDIMDHSITRRGRPCWYTVPGVELVAVNDALYIESAIYKLLRKYLKHKSYYIDIVDLFHETTHQTIVGQSLDMLTSPPNEVNLDNFTLDRYNAIVKYKTAFYSFYLPVACALYMAGLIDKKSHDQSKEILLKMGEYFQIQDDYLDCFGDPEITGKIGTDIEDNKCSWLVVQALIRASQEQRDVLKANYGKSEKPNVDAIKRLYGEMNLKKHYEDYENSSYEEIGKLIENVCESLPKDMFHAFARKIFKRIK